MATLISKATGNFTDASTWALVDSTSLQSNSGVSATPTTAYGTPSGTFTPGAITIDGIAIYVGSRTGSTGTMSVAILQAGSVVSGTEVTINVSDLPNIATYVSPAGIGWVFFKFASPVTLIAATIYAVGIKTSSTTQITVRASVSTNFTRMLRTTTTQAPAAADTLNILGEWTAAGTVSAKTVTMNETATTAYGQLNIGNNGILSYGTAGSTNYYLKTLDIFVQALGTFRIGTSGTPIPSTSTAVLEIAATGLASHGLNVQSLATLEAYGASKTSWTTLAADAAASATSLTVASTTGWAVSDDVVFPTTARSVSQGEKRTLATVPSSTTFTISVGLTNAHLGSGTFAGQALAGQVGNLTRNVKIRGLSTSLSGYVYIMDTAAYSSTYIEYSFLGHLSTTNKRGVASDSTTGTTTISNCAFHDFATGAVAFSTTATTTGGITFSNNVVYSISIGLLLQSTSGVGFIVVDNLVLGVTHTTGVSVYTYNSTITGNKISGFTTGIDFNTSTSAFFTATPTIENNVILGCTTGVDFGNQWLQNTTIGANTVYYCTSTGIFLTAALSGLSVTFDSWNLFGNTSTNIQLFGAIGGIVTFKSCTVNSHSINTSANGLSVGSNTVILNKIVLIDCSFGSISTHTSGDLNFAGNYPLVIEMFNTILASTEISATSLFLIDTTYISSQKHDGVTGAHKIWKRNGIITTDTTIYSISSPSLRVTPNISTRKLQAGSFKVAVASGVTISPSIKVRKSVVGDGAAYNGNQPRLILLANPAAGIAADAVIATASNAANGTFETISGVTSAVTDNCVLEFVVDCDGTAGWINADGFAVSGKIYNNTSYWAKGEPQVFAIEETIEGGGSVGGSAYIAY